MEKITSERFISDVHEVRVPTLVIGIGGIGGRIVSSVYDQLNEYDKTYVEMVVLDTNINDLTDLQEKGISVVQTSENRTVQDYLKSNEDYLEWFPTNPLINSKNLIDGAGQIRSVSRLGGLASEEAGEFNKINDAIYKLRRNRGDSLTKAVKVMIVGSITGGTGSGLGIQLPFYIRNIISKEGGAPDILIRGLFLCPDITKQVQQTENNEDAMYVNGYAFIRELNAFYKAQGMSDDDIRISVEHYDKGIHNQDVVQELQTANQIPYNFMFLLETSNNDGTNLGGLTAYEQQASKIVKNQLFSKMSGAQFSAEDNLIIGSIESQGMNRYCGAGYSAVKYPKDDVMKYCTLKYCDTLIKDYWLYFDRRYEQDSKVQKMNMAHNPTLKPLHRDEHYLRIFNEKTGDIDSPAEIAMLRNDIEQVRIDQETNLEIREKTSDMIANAIRRLINETLDTAKEHSGFDEEMFQMNAVDLKKPENAQGEVTRVIAALKQYFNKTRETVSNLSVDCAGKILPFNLVTANSEENDKPHNLYVKLKKLHPLSIRYIMYELQDKLMVEKKLADSWLADNMDSVIKKDYDDKQDGDQSAAESVGRFATLKFSEKISNFFTGNYNDLIGEIQEDISAELSRIEEYREEKLKSSVYSFVLNGLDKLIKVYEGFFDGLKNVLKENATEIKRVEDRTETIFNGERYICADGLCKQQMFKEVYDNATGEMMTLSDEVKENLFERLFEEYEKLIEKNRNLSKNDEKGLKNASIIFNDCIFPVMQKEVLQFGDDIVDLSIFEAIDKDYSIHTEADKERGILPQLTITQFRTSLFENVANLAEPYLFYKDATESKVVAYWGANHSAVCLMQNSTDNTYDSTALIEMFGNPGASRYADVVDSSFSPYEVVCYKAIYSLRVENLNKFAKNSICYEKYMERLEAVIEGTSKISRDGSGYLTTVHPHLDKRWHNRAYLPLLNDDENNSEEKSNLLVFIMGLGMDVFDYIEYDYLDSWCYTDEKDTYPVLIDGKRLRTKAYTELYRSIDYNKVIKNYIISLENSLKKQAKESINTSESGDDVLEFFYSEISSHSLINALLGDEKKPNVLDIICDVYNSAGNIPFVGELIRFVIAYIKEYVLVMTNNQEGLSEKVAERILNDIYSKSSKIAKSSKLLNEKVKKAFNMADEI